MLQEINNTANVFLTPPVTTMENMDKTVVISAKNSKPKRIIGGKGSKRCH